MPGRERALNAAQDRSRLLHELERKGGRLHAPEAFDQKRVAKLLAQSRQRMADRRLRAAEPLGRTRDAAFGHEDLEHDQEVEVKATQIDFIHGA